MKIGSGKKLIIASLAWVCLMGSPLITQADTHHGSSKIGVSVVEKKGGGQTPPPGDDNKEKPIYYQIELPQTSGKVSNFWCVSLGIVLIVVVVLVMIVKRRRGRCSIVNEENS